MRESRVVVLVGRLCPLSLVAPRPAALMAPSGALTSRLGAPAWQEQLRHQSRWPPASDGAIIVAALACGELATLSWLGGTSSSHDGARHTTGNSTLCVRRARRQCCELVPPRASPRPTNTPS